MGPPTDESNAAMKGDGTSGFGAELEAFRPRLVRMIALRLDRRLLRRVEADDIVQDTFAEAVRRRDDRDDRDDSTDPYLWIRFLALQRLAQVHHHHLGTLQRDAARERHAVPDASSIALASAWLDGGPTPSQVAIGREGRERLESALEAMGSTDREILALRHFEGLTNGQIATLLELSEQAASVRYVRAVKRLRDALGGSVPG